MYVHAKQSDENNTSQIRQTRGRDLPREAVERKAGMREYLPLFGIGNFELYVFYAAQTALKCLAHKYFLSESQILLDEWMYIGIIKYFFPFVSLLCKIYILFVLLSRGTI